MFDSSLVHSPVLRCATPADADTLFHLIQALADYEKLSHEVVGSSAALAHHLSGASPYVEALLAEQDGIVGFALFFTNYSSFSMQAGIYLEDLFVFPAYRRHGIGKALLSALARLAIERGDGRLQWSVLDWNEPAIGFYRHIGATILENTRVCRVVGDALHQIAANQTSALRAAIPADVPALYALARANAEFDGSLADYTGTPEQLGQSLFADTPCVKALVAEVEGTIAGFALYLSNYSTFLTKPGLYVEDLFVLSEYRGKGLGKALLGGLAQEVIDRDFGRLEWCVRLWNQAAIEFYQRQGAVILPDWRICMLSGAALTQFADSRTAG
ncbi:MAG: GNAT family N-acetyltransferase [Leptolyngbyaceae cyanobacterium SL_7_1]|nr:GNAT family N-acetyltransferase [Leptolyngbyaceae cyanobacterium SL_7_1]